MKPPKAEVERLVASVAKGMPPEDVAPLVRQHKAAIAALKEKLRQPRPEPLDRSRLRAALLQRCTEWREVLRGSPEVARLLLRRLVGPITMWAEEGKLPAHIPRSRRGTEHVGNDDVLMWGAEIRPEALLDGLILLDRIPT